MKKLFLIIMLACPIIVTAQVREGLNILEGNIGYSSTSSLTWLDFIADNVESKVKTFHIQPKIGRFITETSVLGLGLGYENTKIIVYDDDEAKVNSFFINPYYSHYHKISDNFYFTSTINLSFGFGNETDFNDNQFDTSSIGITAQPGISYFLNDSWALKTTFGKIYYINNTIKTSSGDQKTKDKSDDFGINFSMDSFSLGISYFF